MRIGFAIVACLLLWCGPASAQSSARDSQPFRTGVEAVEVDVRVVDAHGAPVRGLTRDDFEIFENGVRQDIRTFLAIDVPSAPAARTVTIEPDAQSNRQPFAGRVYVLVLDDLHTHPLHANRVKRVVRRFLDEHMALNDRVALVVTSGRADASQELTSSRTALLTALERFQGRKLRSSTLERIDQYYMNRDIERRRDGRNERIDDPLEPERGHNARVALDTLARVAGWLGSVPVHRKALLFVSEGIDYDIHDVFANREASAIVSSTRDAVAAATRGNVTIYGVDPRGLTLGDDGMEVASVPEDPTLNLGTISMQREIQVSQDSLRTLADETGGFAVVNANDFSTAFDRIVRENTHYYLLGFQPSNTPRDGRFRRLEVRVKRPDARVVARRGYVAEKEEPTRRAEANEEGAPDLRPLLESAIPVSGLALNSSVATFKGGDGKASVLVTLEIAPDLAWKETEGLLRARVDVSMMAISADGRVTDGGQRAVELKLKPETLAHVRRHGFRTLSRLDLAPGRYQLRVAAREQGTNNGGSVIHDVVVPDYDTGSLNLSHLLLASRGAAQAMTTRPDPLLKDRLPLPPTATRTFDRGDVVTIFAEAYDSGGSGQPVELVTTVSDVAGRVVFRSNETVEAVKHDAERRSWTHRIDVPLADLAAGFYVVRVDARRTGGQSSSVSRELVFSVTERQETTP
jgi:VWFA-related protein